MLTIPAIYTGIKVTSAFIVKKGLATKAAAIGYKIWKAHKIGVVMSGMAAIGAAKYTIDCLNNIKKGANNVLDGQYTKAIVNFGKASLYNPEFNTLPEFLQNGLERLNLNTENTDKVISWLKLNDNKIFDYIKKH
ncbi:MAG: hypothetical protein IJR06_00630 [Paludibacteraceae bacterium]|nr:hypothetical protein [Paludibacteraceae bacterium]